MLQSCVRQSVRSMALFLWLRRRLRSNHLATQSGLVRVFGWLDRGYPALDTRRVLFWLDGLLLRLLDWSNRSHRLFERDG